MKSKKKRLFQGLCQIEFLIFHRGLPLLLLFRYIVFLFPFIFLAMFGCLTFRSGFLLAFCLGHTCMQPFWHTILTRCGCCFHISCKTDSWPLCFVAKNVTHCLILISFSVRSNTAQPNIRFQAVAFVLICGPDPGRNPNKFYFNICGFWRNLFIRISCLQVKSPARLIMFFESL